MVSTVAAGLRGSDGRRDAVRMAMEAGCRYYRIPRPVGSPPGARAVREEFGEEMVRAETCTHYTTLDDSIFAELGGTSR